MTQQETVERGTAVALAAVKGNGPSDPATGTSDQLVRRYVRDAQIVSVAMLVALPVLAMVDSPPAAGVVAFLSIALVAFIALHVVAVRSAWRAAAEREPRTGLLLLLTGLAVVAAAVGRGEGDYGWAWLALPGAAAADGLMLGRAPQARAWVVGTALAAAAGVALTTVTSGGPQAGDWWRSAAAAALIVLLIAYLESAGLWLWRQTVQLEEARRDAVELAATRERLRLAEDLHDVLGRTLEVVALKSELASRLVDADAARARGVMEELQHLARSSVHDVRALVRTHRPTDVGREVDAARRLLTSAGVTCEIRGDVDAVPPALRDVLGRVVRESVTNLLRHANARSCSIDVRRSGDELTLEVRNDGVRGAGDGVVGEAAVADGDGLRGMRHRVGEVGGSVRATTVDGTFVVRATVPYVSTSADGTPAD